MSGFTYKLYYPATLAATHRLWNIELLSNSRAWVLLSKELLSLLWLMMVHTHNYSTHNTILMGSSRWCQSVVTLHPEPRRRRGPESIRRPTTPAPLSVCYFVSHRRRQRLAKTEVLAAVLISLPLTTSPNHSFHFNNSLWTNEPFLPPRTPYPRSFHRRARSRVKVYFRGQPRRNPRLLPPPPPSFLLPPLRYSTRSD